MVFLNLFLISLKPKLLKLMIGSKDIVMKSGGSQNGGFCLAMKLLLLSIQPKHVG